jgi:hypothetical protein
MLDGMAYDRRDQIGHWVKRDQQILRPCRHACCRGYWAHPHNWPIIPANRALRRATDEQLASRYAKLTREENDPKARGAELQIISEFERRDRAETKRRDKEQQRRQHREAVASNRAVRRTEQQVEVERVRVASEAATLGYMVNAKGRARGISPDEILTGREAVFRRYASDEALDYFAVNPRPTAAYFRGRDTRVTGRATEPRRRRRGVTARAGRKAA